MIKYDELQYLSVSLPEDVLKEKWSGNFDEERKLIEVFLSKEDLSYAMRCRLEREKEKHRYSSQKLHHTGRRSLQYGKGTGFFSG